MSDSILVALIALVVVYVLYRRQQRVDCELRHLRRERVEVERQRRDAETAARARVDALLNSIAEGVLLLNSEGRIVLVNSALSEMFRLSQDATGKTLLEVLRFHSIAELVEEINRTGQSRDIEVAVPGSIERVFEVSGAPLQHEQSSGVILTFHEITRLKQLENMRKEFVANVSHELRTPLTLIKGFSETLLDGALEDPEASRRFVGTILRHADRLALIIEDLLNISHLESGDVKLEKQALQLNPLVHRLISDLQERAAAKGIHIQNQVSADTIVLADVQRLHQVLTNLLDNAIKYGRENGRVEIKARALPDNTTEIAVVDDGPGIPQEALDRVFERFYRVDKARSREQGGTGLGLSIVKHIIQSHGGRVWAESELEKGSRFYFTLPRETPFGSHGGNGSVAARQPN